LPYTDECKTGEGIEIRAEQHFAGALHTRYYQTNALKMQGMKFGDTYDELMWR